MTAQYADRNPLLSPDLFVGRDRLLNQVTRLLRHGQSTVLIGGRRAGKTTLVRQLTSYAMERAAVFTDISGWDWTTEQTALGGLLSAVTGNPKTIWNQATRADVIDALDSVRPLTLAIDEADVALRHPWGPSFYSFLRWLDDTYLRGDISILLAGGPVLTLFKDPDDRGSPPLNTAKPTFIDSLDRAAVARLTDLVPDAELSEIMDLGGGQAWLTTLLLAEIWDGASLEDATDTVLDQVRGTFMVWQQQLGEDGRELLRILPPAGLHRSELRKSPWVRYAEAARFGRCVGTIQCDGDYLRSGSRLFHDWFLARDTSEFFYDIAISYASEDESLAREIHSQLRTHFKVFFAPEYSAALWGHNLDRVLPNTYGVRSKYVLVLSTSNYVRKHWTRVEYEAVAANAPHRILLLDHGELPDDIPEGVVYRGSSAAELVGLVAALRNKLST